MENAWRVRKTYAGGRVFSFAKPQEAPYFAKRFRWEFLY